MTKAHSLHTSGEALVVKFANAFPLTVVAAAKRRLDDATLNLIIWNAAVYCTGV